MSTTGKKVTFDLDTTPLRPVNYEKIFEKTYRVITSNMATRVVTGQDQFYVTNNKDSNRGQSIFDDGDDDVVITAANREISPLWTIYDMAVAHGSSLHVRLASPNESMLKIYENILYYLHEFEHTEKKKTRSVNSNAVTFKAEDPEFLLYDLAKSVLNENRLELTAIHRKTDDSYFRSTTDSEAWTNKEIDLLEVPDIKFLNVEDEEDDLLGDMRNILK